MIVQNLPTQPTPFVGRSKETEAITTLFADPACRLLTLVGPGEPRYYPVDAARSIAYSPPVWSPDGQLLAFAAYASRGQGNEELYTLKVSTGAVRRLTNNHFRDDSPSWSPDGKRIMFTSNIDHGHDLYMINADGSGLRRLTNSHFSGSVFPIWLFSS